MSINHFLLGGPVTESQCIKIKLKPGKTADFLKWADGLPDRMEEVREAMRSEGMWS
jgi:hypothetical protein